MTTVAANRAFVDDLVNEVIEPAANQMMANRYFTDLREGRLTRRRMQGFSLQHTWFNRALLKAGALRMIKASENEDAFSDAIAGIVAEHDHPDMCLSLIHI